MNSLSFGDINHYKTNQLVNGVVSGIGGYGNCFGVPTVGGETRFDSSYNGNCLVNAFAAGLIDKDKIFYSAASGIGMPVVYLGAKTGRDGVGGATMASAEFDDQIEEKRPTVQVGDPFTEKRLMEACLELMQTGAVISIQDMGAAGLTCSAVEMGDKGNLGISLDLEKVPTREPNMSAYEMMLSESQERMLMVLDPEKENIAKHIFDKWDLDFAIVGETISDDRFLIKLDGVVKADLPLKALAGNAPEYDRPWSEGPPVEELKDVVEINAIDGLKALISSANYSSKSWIYEQYDSQVMADTIERPGFGAGIVRVHGTKKSIAFTSDVTPRYVRANPFEGGKQAVAEAFRNLISVGARPLASTDNLNFGNPEKPEVMGQFVQAVKGISDAVRELNMPIVSGNVSLYNETDGVSINPTPTIGAIGLIGAAETPISGKAYEGNMAVLIGETKGHLGQTALLQEVFNRSDGDAPKVNLETEKKHGNFILTNRNLVNACTDLSDGGLALAAFELAHRSEIGFEIYEESTAFLFGEDQARYLIACEFDQAESLFVEAGKQNIPIQTVGSFKGDTIIFGNSKSDMASLSSVFTDTFKNLFQN